MHHAFLQMPKKEYGNNYLPTLYEQFGTVINQTPEGLCADYISFKEHSLTVDVVDAKDPAKVCKILASESLYLIKYQGLVTLAKIAVSLPVSTAWPERGFSTLSRIKSKSINRILSGMLNSLLQVSTNGPKETARKLAKTWQAMKKRRSVKMPAMAVDVETDDRDEEEMICDDFLNSDDYCFENYFL